MTENEISRMILDCAICVHRELGPGLLESVYEIAMAYELQQRGLRVARHVPGTVRVKQIRFDAAFRADLLVEEKVIVELKSAEQISDAHKKTTTDLYPFERVQTGSPTELW